jgi:hypothetical protein
MLLRRPGRYPAKGWVTGRAGTEERGTAELENPWDHQLLLGFW